jgi:RNA-directed DNA polymerase
MLERIVSKENMTNAYDRVVGNEGCAGVDNMKVTDLKPYLHKHWTEIKKAILDGSYRPQSVRGIEIDKPKG